MKLRRPKKMSELDNENARSTDDSEADDIGMINDEIETRIMGAEIRAR